MVAAKKTASLKKNDPGTASTTVAVKPNTNIVSIEEQMRADLATLNERTQAAGGDKLRLTTEKTFELPDGRSTAGPIEMVVVDFVSANNFYDQKYDPKNPTPPACFAIGTVPTTLVPSKNSPDQQADSCSVCPNNQYGSDGDGKACKNTRLLAVLAPDAKEGDPLMMLSVPPTSIKNFDGFVRNVAAQFKRPPVGVIVKVEFDQGHKYPRLLFGDPKPTPPDLLQLAMTYRETARARLTAEPDVSSYGQKPAGRSVAKKPAARR